MSFTRRSLAAAVVAALAPAAPAVAGGPPLPSEQSRSGVASLDGADRYLAVTLGGKTAVLAQRAASGAVTSRLELAGRFGIPLVAYDSTGGGLSGDGRTLVLVRPRAGFPRRSTTFAVLSTHGRLRLRRVVRLRGDFSFDALSRDGRSLFLVNYVSPRDPTKYRVRVYDLARRRLDPKPIVDPREAPDEMNGFALSRATSADGRWAYTLYQGTDGKPFIHALDTRDRKAVCIDLDDPALARGDAFELRLTLAGARLDVRRRSALLATVDTATLRVRSGPAAVAEARAQQATGDPAGPHLRWPAVALALLGAGLVAGLALRRRARPRAEPAAALAAHDSSKRLPGKRFEPRSSADGWAEAEAIDDEAVAQAAVADDERVAAELREHGAHDARAREDDLGAGGLQPDDRAPLVR